MIVVNPLNAKITSANPAIKPVVEFSEPSGLCVNSNVDPDTQSIVSEKVSMPPIFNNRSDRRYRSNRLVAGDVDNNGEDYQAYREYRNEYGVTSYVEQLKRIGPKRSGI